MLSGGVVCSLVVHGQLARVVHYSQAITGSLYTSCVLDSTYLHYSTVQRVNALDIPRCHSEKLSPPKSDELLALSYRQMPVRLSTVIVYTLPMYCYYAQQPHNLQHAPTEQCTDAMGKPAFRPLRHTEYKNPWL